MMRRGMLILLAVLLTMAMATAVSAKSKGDVGVVQPMDWCDTVGGNIMWCIQ